MHKSIGAVAVINVNVPLVAQYTWQSDVALSRLQCRSQAVPPQTQLAILCIHLQRVDSLRVNSKHETQNSILRLWPQRVNIPGVSKVPVHSLGSGSSFVKLWGDRWDCVREGVWRSCTYGCVTWDSL